MFGSDFVYYLALGCLLAAVAVWDLRSCRIPNSLVLSNSMLALCHAVLTQTLWSSVVGGVLAFALFGALAIASRQLGAGDVKLAMSIGLITGWPDVLSALYCGIAAGALVTAFLLRYGRVSRYDTVPYGPYLCLGVGLLWVCRLTFMSQS